MPSQETLGAAGVGYRAGHLYDLWVSQFSNEKNWLSAKMSVNRRPPLRQPSPASTVTSNQVALRGVVWVQP